MKLVLTKVLPHGRTWPFPSSIGGADETENAQGSKEREPSSPAQSWQPPKEYRYGD